MDAHELDSKLSIERLQRLRVNRVAIVQCLRVEHILNHLIRVGVLTEDNKTKILASKTTQDKARVLVDFLPKHFPGKPKDWYGQFKEALRNPETRRKDVKKTYEMLIDFMDNTIIHIPRPSTPVSQSDLQVNKKTYPRYEPLPGINQSQAREKGQLEANIPENSNKDSSQQPGNFASVIDVPLDHFDKLHGSDNPDDLDQLQKEEQVIECMRAVEIVYALDKRGLMPDDFEISTSKAVQQMLSDPNLYHFYFKYLLKLKLEQNMPIITEIAVSYVNYIGKQGVADDDGKTEQVKKKIELLQLIYCKCNPI